MPVGKLIKPVAVKARCNEHDKGFRYCKVRHGSFARSYSSSPDVRSNTTTMVLQFYRSDCVPPEKEIGFEQ